MKVTLESLSRLVQGLQDRLTRLEKDIKGLKDILNVHDNWNAEIREWKGKPVVLHTTDGKTQHGALSWSDRYNVCLTDSGRVRIFNKGSIVSIERG